MPSIRHTGDPEIDSLNTDVAKEIAVQHAHEEPTEHHDHDHDEHAHGVDWQDLVRILFVALAAAAVWFRVWEPLAHFSIIGIAATLIGGYPIFKEAVENIFEGRMTMELSMTIALVAALLVGEFFTALVIALFVLAAEVLEGLTVGRGRRAIEELVNLLPRSGTVRRDGRVSELPITEIRIGDRLLINPGSRVPADGTVLDGHSFVDQASITGESMPVEKTAGALVYAGTINQSGALEIRADRLGNDTTFGKIIEAVERAERSRAPIQRTADRLAGYLVYLALGAAALTLLITHNARSTISVIIVAGACGIAAGTPLAVLGAIGRAAREGSIVKGGLFLELLSQVDTAIFDKTGTLTFGQPEVIEVVPADGIGKQAVLETAALAERRSEHPLAKAVVRKAIEQSIALRDAAEFRYTPGKGIISIVDGDAIAVGNHLLMEELGIQTPGRTQHEGATEVLVARRGAFLGTILIADNLRPEAAVAVRDLQKMGLKIVLLTGDSQSVAKTVARCLGIASVYPELLPQQKLEKITAMVDAGRKVVMLGDGINDAPALTKATVGVAMGSGTDVARESADVVLIGSDLAKFVETIRIGRKCMKIIMQNFYGTIAVDSLGVLLAAMGMLNPLLAAFIHVSSELTFILNSTRMLPRKAHTTSALS